MAVLITILVRTHPLQHHGCHNQITLNVLTSIFITVKSGDTCDKIAKKHGISTKEFMSLNSQINSKCTNLHVHKKYCVEEGSSSSSSSSSSSGSSSSGGCSKKHKGNAFI